MTTITNPTIGTTATTGPLATVWRHVDAIYIGSADKERNLLTQAAEYIEAVRVALLSGKPIDFRSIGNLLDCASLDIKTSNEHLESVIEELGLVA